VSNFGSMLTAVALPLLAIGALDAKPSQIAGINAAASLPPILLGLFAAHAVDRTLRRPVLIGADLLRALLLLALPIAAFAGHLSIAAVLVFALLRGLLDFVFDVAHHAYLPSLVARAELARANGRLEAAGAAAEAGAFAAGGWLVQWLSAPLALLLDAASYLASALFLWRIGTSEPAPARVTASGMPWAELGAGLSQLARVPALRAIALSTVLLGVANQITSAVYMLFVFRELGFPAGVLGLLFSLGSVASFASATTAARVPRRIAGVPSLALGLALRALGSALLPLAPGANLFGVAAIAAQQIVGDGGSVLWQVHQVTLRQELTPQRLLGRVSGALRILGGLSVLVGTAAGGWLGDRFGLRTALWVAAGIGALAAVTALRAEPPAAES
jgi:MFS family permease